MRTFGKYRLVEPLASGGMADVWRAQWTGAEGVVKEVALKLVRGEHAEKSEFVRMFIEEARLAARLSHANVVQVFEFDQVDGRYYIAMELVRGRHLGAVVEAARAAGLRLGLARALHVGAEVARALAYAHRVSDGGRPLGLVHRDVSPHNVLVSFEGEVKLADFGIARAMNATGLTDPGTVKGKAPYMAPEQARGGAVDARADVFSLGVVLWELCTGRRLFLRDTDAATIAAVLSDEPVSPPSAWNEAVPPRLDDAILAALERDPERRTGSAQELATTLAGQLLQVARSPDDLDMRTFMHAVFPAESAAASAGSAPEPTRVRRAPRAREADAAGADRTAVAREESATRTAVGAAARPGRAARRGRVAAAAALAAALAVGGWTLSRGRVPGQVEPPSPSPGSAPTPAVDAAAEGPRAPATAPAEPVSPPPAAPEDAAGSPGAAPPPLPAGAPAPPEAAAPSSRAARPRRAAAGAEPRPAPLEAVHGLNRLQTPPAASGEGILAVNASPWGAVIVNGVPLGETPREVRLPAGSHRVRIERPNRPSVEEDVTVEAGRRTKLLR